MTKLRLISVDSHVAVDLDAVRERVPRALPVALIASNIGGKPASRRERDLLVRGVANALREASRDEAPN